MQAYPGVVLIVFLFKEMSDDGPHNDILLPNRSPMYAKVTAEVKTVCSCDTSEPDVSTAALLDWPAPLSNFMSDDDADENRS